MKRLLVLGVLLWAMPAHAEKVGVLGLDAEAGSERVANWTTDALRRWVLSRGMQLGPRKTLAETKLVFGCDRERPSCMVNVARTMGVSTLVWGRVLRRGGQYVVSLKALRTSRPGSVDSASHRLSIRAANQRAIRRLAGGWAAALIGGVTTGTLAISGGPVGAVVWVDGKEVGPLPSSGTMSLDLQPGRHVVRLVKDGYVARTASAQVRVGAPSHLRLVLQPKSRPSVRPAVSVSPRVVKVNPEAVHDTYVAQQTNGGQEGETQGRQEEPSNPKKKWQIAFYVTAGVAAAVFVAGAATGIGMLLRARKVDQAYDDAGVADVDRLAHPCNGPDPALKSWCEKGQKMATIANALYGTSAVVAVAAGVMSYWAFFKKYDDSEKQTGAEESAGTVRFAPMMGRVNGLQLQLDF